MIQFVRQMILGNCLSTLSDGVDVVKWNSLGFVSATLIRSTADFDRMHKYTATEKRQERPEMASYGVNKERGDR